MAVNVTPEQVRSYIRDRVDKNYLLDNEVQFTDERISNAMTMVLDDINLMPPLTQFQDFTVLPAPLRSLVIVGTLKHLFYGESAFAARNQMSYSDGGLTIPIEERFQYWLTLAESYNSQFMNALKSWKIAANLEGGMGHGSWGEIRSDYAKFPSW